MALGALRRELALGSGRQAHLIFTTRSEGDLAVDSPPEELRARREAVADLPWVWLRQVHGARVVVAPDDSVAGLEADAAVTTVEGLALAVHTADCVPIALAGEDGVLGAVHAGWRGLLVGVVDATVREMRAHGPGAIRAVVGPHIGVGCYAFGSHDLEPLVRRFGPRVRGRTAAGEPALDLTASCTLALDEAGVEEVELVGGCTACEASRYYSHRARGEVQRQALVTWLSG